MNNLNFAVKYCPKCLELYTCDNNFNWNTCTSCKIGLFRHQKLIEVILNETESEYLNQRFLIASKYNKNAGIYEEDFLWLYEMYLKDSPEYDNSKFEADLNRFREKDMNRKINFEEKHLTAIHCPNCDSTNTEKISTTKKVASTAVLGLASSTIGKNYKCKNCGYIW